MAVSTFEILRWSLTSFYDHLLGARGISIPWAPMLREAEASLFHGNKNMDLYVDGCLRRALQRIETGALTIEEMLRMMKIDPLPGVFDIHPNTPLDFLVNHRLSRVVNEPVNRDIGHHQLRQVTRWALWYNMLYLISIWHDVEEDTFLQFLEGMMLGLSQGTNRVTAQYVDSAGVVGYSIFSGDIPQKVVEEGSASVQALLAMRKEA